MAEQEPRAPTVWEAQIERLGWFGYSFSLLPESALWQYAKWLERRTGGDTSKARAIIDAACEADRLPTGPELRAIAERLYPSKKQTRPVASIHCQHCHGSGWLIHETMAGQPAEECPCGGVPPGNSVTHDVPVDDDEAKANIREFSLLTLAIKKGLDGGDA